MFYPVIPCSGKFSFVMVYGKTFPFGCWIGPTEHYVNA
jgi:hypothetical protein